LKSTQDLAAQEAAARAFAQVCKSLEELQVTPELRVGEFLSSGPDTRARVYETVRRAVRSTGPQVYSDGVTAVQVELPIREAVRALAEACRAEGGEGTATAIVPGGGGVSGLNPSPAFSSQGHPLPRERGEAAATATTAAAGPGAGKFQPQDFEKIVLYTDREALWGLGESNGTGSGSLGTESPAGWGDLGVFGRLKARHDAAENAYRQMLEQIRALRVSAARTVGEFLGSDKRIAADIEVFIRSHPAAGARYLPERICEVDVTLALADLVGELKSLANAYEVAAYPAEAFNGVSLNAGEKALTVTGVAVPGAPVEEPGAAAETVWTRTAEAELPDAADDAQQGRLLGARAALAVVREQMRRAILELPLGAGTVAAAVDENPALRKDIDTFLVNLREVKVRNLKGNRVEVTAEIAPGRMREVLEFYRKKMAAK
jgi:hypothetical protein